MAIKTPIILNGNYHSPLSAGDTIDPQFIKIVSADAGNDITSGSDGGAFIDLDSAAVTEKIQDAVGAALASPLTYNDVLNTIGSSAITSVVVGAGLSGNGLSGTPIVPAFNALPASAAGALPAATKLVVSGGTGEIATTAQVGALLAPDVLSAIAKGDLIAGTNVTLAGSGVGKLLGSGNVTVNVSGAAPTGTASGDLSGSFPAPTVAKIQGTGVSATAPTSGQALVYNGTNYVPTSVIAGVPATTPVPAILNTSSIPTQYIGQSSNFYLGEPKAYVRFASASSSTGFLAMPLYEIT